MPDKKKMEDIRSHFSEGSERYDVQIRKAIPRYDEMLDVLVSCVASEQVRARKVIDIGCGTGALSAKLLEVDPDIKLTCLDMTGEMLDKARDRLGDRENVRFVLADFHDFEFDESYTHMISSLALHHAATDKDKIAIYRKIFGALAPGGSFYNADLVLGSSDELQELYMRRWTEFMYQGLRRDEVEEDILPRYRREDSPVRLTDHLRWMSDIGFKEVDVAWKWYNFAVYGGRKSASR